MKHFYFLCLFTFLSYQFTYSQIYVDEAATGANNGTSWADAYSDLQPALDNAAAGNEIWVAEGTYLPTTTTDRTISFEIPENTTLYGGFSPINGAVDLATRNFRLHETILSGDIGTTGDNSDNSYTVVATLSVSNINFDGFTVQDGNANNTSLANETNHGGGWYNEGRIMPNENIVIQNAIFKNNEAFFGGAIFNSARDFNFSFEILNTQFIENTARDSSYGNGTGGALQNSVIGVNNNSATLYNCSFFGNTAEVTTAYRGGGAIFNFTNVGTLTTTIVNSTFSENTSNSGGAAIYNYNVQGNNNLTSIITNSILYNNSSTSGNEIDNTNTTPNISYSLIEGVDNTANNGLDGTNPANAPLFTNPANDDFTLQATSPVIDLGDNTAVTQPTDLNGDVRILDGDGDTVATVDFGTYETSQAQSGCEPPTNPSIIYVTESEAAISWTAGPSGETNWTIIFGVEGFDPMNSGTSVQSGTPSLIIPGLNEGTTYDYYVYADCSVGNQSVALFGQFTTLFNCPPTFGNVSIVGGHLIYNDYNGVDDDITIVVDGANYRISDPNGTLAACNGTTQDGTDILAPLASVTGEIQINTLGGDDLFNVDFTGGNFPNNIAYNGGSQTTTPGDLLTLNGGTFASVVHTFFNENDGNVAVSGNNTITYTGLEPVIDNLDVADRVFTYTGGLEIITMQNEATVGSNLIDSTLGESVTFTNPTNSLTIKTEASGGSGTDTIIIEGLDTAFNANLTVNAGADDVVRFQTNPAHIGTGTYDVNAAFILSQANISTSGSGAIIFNATDYLEVRTNAIITSENGDINLNSNSAETAIANSIAMSIFGNSEIRTTGTGTINLNGVSKGNAGFNFNPGVAVGPQATIENTGSGSINITGKGGVGTGFNVGANIQAVIIKTIDGGITINGTSGTGTGNDNYGINVYQGAIVEATGSGIITLDGTSTAGFNDNNGINIANAGTQIIAAGGAINITGQGAINGTTVNNRGVLLSGGATIDNIGMGVVNITGTGGAGTFSNKGVEFLDVDTAVTTVNGGITINGISGMATAGNNVGISIRTGAQIEATGTGFITMEGTSPQSTDFGDGINVIGATTAIKAAGGAITITGQAAQVTTGQLNYGVEIENSLIENTGPGSIAITGNGGDGTLENNGLEIAGATIRTNNGGLSLFGTSGMGTGNTNRGISLFSTVIEATGSGALVLDGTSAGSSQSGDGIFSDASIISSKGGGILITGQGANSATGPGQNGIRMDNNNFVRDNNRGTITVNGTSGNGSGNNQGVDLSMATITATTGNVIVTGTSTSTGNLGVGIILFNNTTLNTNIGNLEVTGTSASAANSAIFLFDLASSIKAGGTTTLTAITGALNTADGIPPTPQIQGTVVTINGEVQPGNPFGTGIAQLPIIGNTILSTDDVLTININGITTQETDFDQLAVTGTVDVTGATLNLIDGLAANVPANTEIILIDNDGTDAVIGTFASSNVAGFNGQQLRIIYNGGDGNDVALVVGIPNVEVVVGDLVIIDNEDRDDTITIVIEGLNYRVSDPNNELIAGAGATQDGPNAVLVLITSVTGEILVETMGGDDNFTTDFSGGNFTDAISYNGGTQTTGDAMSLTGVSPTGAFASVEHTFVNESDGSVAVSGNSIITYTGLEPIIDNLSATDRIFSFTGGAEFITLDAGGTLDNQIDSTQGESVDFNNPTNSLTINTNNGVDVVNIEGVGAGFDADLTITSDLNDDDVNFQVNPTNVGSGDVSVTSEQLTISADVTTTGNFTSSTTGRTFASTSTVQTTNGTISITGGTAPSGTRNYTGVTIENGNLLATGSGNIVLNGTGSNTGVAIGTRGVLMSGTSTIQTTTGNIDITGAASSTGAGSLQGVLIQNPSIVQTADGVITLDGTGGSGSGAFQIGIFLFNGNPVQATGDGSIVMIGNAGTGTNVNYGILLQDASITTSGGGITLNGTGGNGSGDFNCGTVFLDGANASDSGAGNIIITGTGGSGIGGNDIGVIIDNVPTTVTSNTGTISITGMGGTATGNSNHGINVSGGTIISSTGNGDITFFGTTGIGDSSAVNFEIGNDFVSTGGDVTVTALAGEINTPPGIHVSALFDASETIINGILAPGQSPGQLVVDGNFTMAADDTFEVEVTDFNTSGSQYDQVAVTGTVDITDATLTLVDNTAETGELCDELTIIDNDDTDAIIGEFAGAAEGTDLPFNGELWRISYTGGDGNDVILAFNPGMVAAPICMDITLQLDANGTPITITPADLDGGTPMGCDFDSLSIDMDTFDCSNVGPNNVELTVTDIFGNTNSCTAIVTVEDNIPPTAFCPADITQVNDPGECGAVVNFTIPAPTDNCAGATATASPVSGSPVSGSTFPVGTTVVTVTATDASGNTNMCTFDVTVEDNEDPVAVCGPPIRVLLGNSGSVSITPADLDGGSTDNCSTTLSLSQSTFTCDDLGVNLVTVTATDAAGNSTSCNTFVTVEDEVAPVAQCVAPFTLELDENGQASITTADIDGGSTDACGMGTADISIDRTDFTCADIGDNTVTMTIMDAAGNSDSCTTTVTIIDNLAPVLTCPANQTVEADANGEYAFPDYFATGEATADDNCTVAVTTTQIPEPGRILPVGNYTVRLTTEDANGNTSDCSFEVVVETSLGVDGFDTSRIALYPNPVQDALTIDNPDGLQLTRAVVYDLAGRVVSSADLRGTGTRTIMNLSELASATYIVVVTGDGRTLTKQIVKE